VTLEEGVAVMLEHIQDWKNAPLWNVNKIEEATKSWFKFLGENN